MAENLARLINPFDYPCSRCPKFQSTQFPRTAIPGPRRGEASDGVYPSPSRDTRLVKRDSLLKPEVNEKTRADRAEKARKRTAPARRADVGTPETAAGTEPPVPCERSCHAAGLTRGGGCRALPATAAASAAGEGSFHQGWAGETKRTMQRRTNNAPRVLFSLERWGLLYRRNIPETASTVSSF